MSRLGTLALSLICASLAAGCSVVTDAGNAYIAPVGVIPASDVVIQTNLETDLEQVQAYGAEQGSLTGFAASGWIAGASGTPGETSFDAPTAGAAVLAVYNDADRNCYGIVYIVSSTATPLLGETGPGTSFFVDPHAAPGTCSSATFATEIAPPSGWPSADPSSSGFPSP
jgi:hypothetical protein